MRTQSKENKHLMVSQAILRVIFNEGLTGLNLSKVASQSKVSRAWIYEYMGKNRNDLIQVAADSCAAFFSRAHITSQPKTLLELQQQLNEGAIFSVQACIQHPILLQMYFKFKGTSNNLGQTIEKYEDLWLKNFTKFFRQILKINEKEALMLAQSILMIRLGTGHQLITQKKASEKTISEAMNQLVSLQQMLLQKVMTT